MSPRRGERRTYLRPSQNKRLHLSLVSLLSVFTWLSLALSLTKINVVDKGIGSSSYPSPSDVAGVVGRVSRTQPATGLPSSVFA